MPLPPIARVFAAAAAVAVALPAAAYILPAPAILRLAAKKRVDSGVGPVELRGTFSTGATAPAAAVLWVKGNRCRLELVGAQDRPYAIVRGGRVAVQRGLDGVAGALALAEGACALLAPGTVDAYVQSFAARGVAVQDVTLGRLGNRVAYVLGGRAADAKPQAWIEKPALLPMRLVADLAGARRDVRLLDYPAPPPSAERNPPPPPAADLFPRTIEVHGPDGLEAKLSVEKVGPTRIADSLL
jgi:hypothetical protein